MSRETIREYSKAIYNRYQSSSKELKRLILEEFRLSTGYNRKYAIRRFNTLPSKAPKAHKRRRKPIYGPQVISVIAALWKTAGYPCSVRQKALVILWMPWIRKRFRVKQAVERQFLSIIQRSTDGPKTQKVKKPTFGSVFADAPSLEPF